MRRHSTAMVFAALTLIAARGDAQAGQTQSKLTVTARVLVSTTVNAAVADSAPAVSSGADQSPQTDARASSPTAAKAPATSKPTARCATIAVRCSGRTPIRLSIDGRENDVASECVGTGGKEQPVSLCAESDGGKTLGITVEY